MATLLEIDRYNWIPLSVTSLYARPCHSFSKNTLLLTRRCSKVSRGVVFNGSKGIYRVRSTGILENCRLITAVARAESDRLGEDSANQDVFTGHKLPMKEDSAWEHQQKVSQLRKRIVFGLGIGISVGGVVLAGGWVFTVFLAAAVFVGSREYFELVRSGGITKGMTPPPRYVSRVCSVICALMPILTL